MKSLSGGEGERGGGEGGQGGNVPDADITKGVVWDAGVSGLERHIVERVACWAFGQILFHSIAEQRILKR